MSRDRDRWTKAGITGLALLLAVALGGGLALAQGPRAGEGKRLPRWYEGAPPFVPHDVEDRKAFCQDCHTTGEQGAPITPHPTRTHFCIQCHVPQSQAVPPFEKTRGK
jgi:nitrate reductase cytochrome c-type subunit